jgi:hypothetical protein
MPGSTSKYKKKIQQGQKLKLKITTKQQMLAQQ